MANDGWPTRKLLDLLEIELPIVQSPMLGAQDAALVAAVSAAGGLGSLPCSFKSAESVREEVRQIRAATNRGFLMNFFCHRTAPADPERDARWRQRLAPYYAEVGVEQPAAGGGAPVPFDETLCTVVEETRPRAVSFHFGLPADELLARVRATGAKILCSATTVREARFLAAKGVDAVIAQGAEAGGHRGMFLTDDVASQIGTFALVPQIADAVEAPVIAAGGIVDGRGIAAAFALGASGVQIGTAYLKTPEARISDLHRSALRRARDEDSVLTNVLSGRPARGIATRFIREAGPLSPEAPAFPLGNLAIGPIRAAAEAQGKDDFSALWTGQAGPIAREGLGAKDLTLWLADDALRRLRGLTG